MPLALVGGVIAELGEAMADRLDLGREVALPDVVEVVGDAGLLDVLAGSRRPTAPSEQTHEAAWWLRKVMAFFLIASRAGTGNGQLGKKCSWSTSTKRML